MLVNNNSSRFRSALGESLEDYLEAILLLGAQKRPVRVKDIAHFLGVSRPSVVNALNQLKNKGLVRHEHYGDVELTIRGQNYATTIYQRHHLLEQFLHQVLGVSARIAAQDACRLEHALSPETARRLLGFVRRIGVK
ncbi:MAG: metal-dependent transcriptional regulator [candidate division WOR-3 bacterium]|jgi:DtxR family Mn-dependent transcriptional regulator|nr:metal-dependent transcriptional regulator [candidate division WOR-3 bacterium]MCR4424496.1 metal-dependent transcriptional regulator [candidate division WOR-3 bacterium]MDH7519656.1 metal-dependent transcriptional regulator [bacterium]